MSLKPPLPPNVILDYRHVYDEGTQQSAEDGINFTGAGVTVTEDTVNHRLNVTIPGGGGGSGNEPYQVVEDLSGDPRSVTDWGTIINTAITNGTRRFLFGPFDYPFSTRLALENPAIQGAVFEGAGGRNWGGGASPTRLIWKGTGTGAAITLGPNASGTIFREIGIYYNQPTFTGDLIVGVPSGGDRFENCQISSLAPATTQARCLVNCDGFIGTYFINCEFWGAQHCVRGYDNRLTNEASNNISFRDCVFGSFDLFGASNPGYEWLFDGCIWEFDSGGPNAVGVGSDYDYGGVDKPHSVVTITGECSFWDAAYTTQKSIKQYVGSPWNLKIQQATFHNAGRTVPDVDLQGIGSVHIEDCIFGGASGQPVIDLGNVSVNGAASRKEQITIRNVEGFSADPNSTISNIAGHGQVQIENLGTFSNGRAPQLRTIGGYERVMTAGGAQQRPSVTAHAGSAGIGVAEISGTDMAGTIQVGTSGVPTAGLVLDVTFGTPMYPDYRTVGYKTWLAVQLTPGAIATIAPDGDVAAGVGLYYQIVNASTDPMVASTGFVIGFKTAPAAGKIFAISYRVVQL